MLLAVALAAAASGGTFDPTTWLIAQGPLGVMCAGLIYALKKERDRADTERTRADAATAGKDAMVTALLERVVPALTESTAASRELAISRRDRDTR